MTYRIIVRLDTTPETAADTARQIRDLLQPVFGDVGTVTVEEWLYELYHRTPADPVARPRVFEAEHDVSHTNGKVR